MLANAAKKFLRNLRSSHYYIKSSVITCNSYEELLKLWHWCDMPDLSYLPKVEYQSVEDINGREAKDAEVLMAICKNVVTTAVLEIGTSTGLTTLGLAHNAPHATIYTVDIPQDEALSGKGGRLITHVIDPDVVGYHYKKSGVTNIRQIFANTASWVPDLPQLDLVFIDGCHDRKFVYNDTLKLIPFVKRGGVIVWHDANPSLTSTFPWIGEVCGAIGDLIKRKHISPYLFHVRDSWMTVWRKI